MKRKTEEENFLPAIFSFHVTNIQSHNEIGIGIEWLNYVKALMQGYLTGRTITIYDISNVDSFD